MEAVPACFRVASYRYQDLVNIILNLERLEGFQGKLERAWVDFMVIKYIWGEFKVVLRDLKDFNLEIL